MEMFYWVKMFMFFFIINFYINTTMVSHYSLHPNIILQSLDIHVHICIWKD